MFIFKTMRALILRALPIVLTVLLATGAEARQVLIEGEKIRMNIGDHSGHGIRSALARNDLIKDRGRRDNAYRTALKRIKPRLSGARVVVREHQGGRVYGVSADVEDINALGLPVRIVGHHCNSACTLFLGAKDVCVSPSTLFGFHQPRAEAGKPPLAQDKITAASRHMSKHYKPGLKTWWVSTGSQSKQLVYVTGKELIRIGYKAC